MSDHKIAPSRMEWDLLRELCVALESGETAGALAATFRRPEPSVRRTLARMERHGLVTSRMEDGLGRVWMVTLGGLRVRAALAEGLRVYREVTG